MGPDEIQRFPYNVQDNADIDAVLEVRKLICLFVCHFDFQKNSYLSEIFNIATRWAI